MTQGLPEGETISMREAMELSGRSQPTLVSYLETYNVNNLPIGVKVGGRWVIHKGQLEKFLRGFGQGQKGGTT